MQYGGCVGQNRQERPDFRAINIECVCVSEGAGGECRAFVRWKPRSKVLMWKCKWMWGCGSWSHLVRDNFCSHTCNATYLSYLHLRVQLAATARSSGASARRSHARSSTCSRSCSWRRATRTSSCERMSPWRSGWPSRAFRSGSRTAGKRSLRPKLSKRADRFHWSVFRTL